MKERLFVNKLCVKIVIVLLCLSINNLIPVCVATEIDEDMSIKLQSVRIDSMGSANILTNSYPTEKESYIVQFTGPVKDEYKKQISDLGVIFYGYVPNYAFIVRMDDATRQTVESLSFIRWVGLYHPGYKISPYTLEKMGNDETIIVNILIFDVEKDAVTSDILDLGGNILFSSNNKIRVSIDNAKLPEIASINGVMWIENYKEKKTFNDESAQIMNVDPIVWDTHGLTGAGQIIAVADTGLDTGINDASMHDDFEGKINNIHSWPIQPGWDPYINNDGADDGASDQDSGHGTHVSGSVLGDGTRSSGDIKGIGYNADLVFQAMEQYVDFIPAVESLGYTDGYYLFGIPDDLNDLFQEAYDDGARIHTNSWGSSADGEYDSDAFVTDRFIWDHKTMSILFGAGNNGIDSDSDGVVDYDSICSPGTAKNVITVGASENLRLSGGYQITYGTVWPTDYPANPIYSDLMSDNSNGMVAFSSRGPCDDGRIKPDVIAQGTNILSTRSSVASGMGWGTPYNAYYMYMGGTSMSTPLTAGAVALIRQYFMEDQSHTPTAALIKATLINGAYDMPGQYVPDETGPTPNYNSGWGRVDLANSLFPTLPKVLLFNDSEFLLSTGENQNFYYEVVNNANPLSITLVWTDYPAIVPAGGIVNDLDLIITSPSGDVYHGNDLITPFDDSYDRTNNIEQVKIGSPSLGVYNVTINAFNIPNGPQDFSLAIIGAVEQVNIPPTNQIQIPLYSGWNLISAPLNLNTWELGQESIVGDPLNVIPENSLSSIYRYDTTSESFEMCVHHVDWGWDPATGSESFTALEPGKGYWVMAENDCILTFTGTAPSDLDISLDTGWNCVGWYSTSEAELGEESLVIDPFNVTPDNSLESVYRYDTTLDLFEMSIHHNNWGWDPATGSESFTELEPGKGYWVMADNDCEWKHETYP